MCLLQHPNKNIYLIFVALIFYEEELLALENIRVLLPSPGDEVKIVIEKGRVYSFNEKRIECKNVEDSDEITKVIKNNVAEPEEGLMLIDIVESKKAFNISLKDGIVLSGYKEKVTDLSSRRFNSLLFRNEASTIEINGRFLRGDLELVRGAGGVKIINDLNVEDYLRYTISKEMNPNWPIEALKAQAVLARTFVLKKKYSSKNCLYDISNTTLDQVYNSFSEDSLEVIQAVSSTKGEVLKYNGEIIDALYHSCCGGMTTSSWEVFGFDKPYLVAVNCRCGGECPFGKGWRLIISVERLKKLFGLKKIEKISEERGKIRIIGDRNISLSKNSFRERIGFTELKSSDFVIKFSNSKVEVIGKGFGHGVGLCQFGAKKMAEEGKNYKEILLHYFKGVTLEKIY
ncbi:MAG: SpoIID/LytB domain-containing protein [Deltaproteobacteria bacterium]|nr:SpoIID/LytB domain-containing protein [Deltaproteobacteria bacterium]